MYTNPSPFPGPRGFGGRFVLIDEAAYVDQELFYRVIAPVLQVKHTVLFCITSPSDDDNWFSRLTSFVDDDGQPLVFSHNFKAVCKENYGIITSSAVPCFHPGSVEQAFDIKRRFNPSVVSVQDKRAIPALFCCIDPNGGGLNNSAIVIGYRNDMSGQIVLCWADFGNTKNLPQFENFVLTNVLAFRSAYPEFRNTKLVIVTEANSRFDGDYVQRVLSRMGQFRGEGVGADTIGELEFFSDNGVKMGMNKQVQRSNDYILHANIHFEEGTLLIHRKFGTANTGKYDAKLMLQEMRDQLKRFRWPDADKDNPRYRGKAGPSAKWNGLNDDLAVATLMTIYFSFHYTVTKRQYVEYLKRYDAIINKVKERQVRETEKLERILGDSEYNPMKQHMLSGSSGGKKK